MMRSDNRKSVRKILKDATGKLRSRIVDAGENSVAELIGGTISFLFSFGTTLISLGWTIIFVLILYYLVPILLFAGIFVELIKIGSAGIIIGLAGLATMAGIFLTKMIGLKRKGTLGKEGSDATITRGTKKSVDEYVEENLPIIEGGGVFSRIRRLLHSLALSLKGVFSEELRGDLFLGHIGQWLLLALFGALLINENFSVFGSFSSGVLDRLSQNPIILVLVAFFDLAIVRNVIWVYETITENLSNMASYNPISGIEPGFFLG